MLDDDRREGEFREEEEKVIVPEDKDASPKSFVSFFKQFFGSLGPGVVTGGYSYFIV
jgi:hypothetical protein